MASPSVIVTVLKVSNLAAYLGNLVTGSQTVGSRYLGYEPQL